MTSTKPPNTYSATLANLNAGLFISVSTSEINYRRKKKIKGFYQYNYNYTKTFCHFGQRSHAIMQLFLQEYKQEVAVQIYT